MTENNQPGLYEQLLTNTLQRQLEQLSDPRLYSTARVDADDAHTAISQFLEHALASGLASFRGVEAVERQKRVVDRILSILVDELGQDWEHQFDITTPLRRLLAIHRTSEQPFDQRPDTPLSRSALLTGTRLDPSLGSQLKKEIATADSVDILCSFIKWSGLRVILDELRALAEQPADNGPRIRVITTSYMGATDPKAIEELSKLPNTEIRVSYDTKRTRLHAKAYLFHRLTDFGNAYVGSANLSNAALSEGLEWTTKISQYELSYLWGKITGTFETYWQDEEFQRFTGADPERLRQAIHRERSSASDPEINVKFDLRPYPFQEEILDILKAERELQGKRQHLVVAATGTGKTMIAAFDYARVCREKNRQPSFLFIVHREEILKQALASFRAVLRDQNFGDLLVGGREPAQNTHLFCSIQSYNSRELGKSAADAYEYVVVDEFHHAAAPSYRRLLDHIRPDILLGLTATPERSDQLDVLQRFGGRTSAEIRLPDAINRKLLCPFQYFGVADSVDLDGLTWQRGGYSIEELDQIYTGNDVRARLILDKTHQILLHPYQARGLGFCVSKAHAEFMARYFNESGISAAALTADSSNELRRAVQNQLRTREINFIFVVDLYNEGVDIPEVDTLLLLRPTESMMIFLQQLGRGMRLHEEKECLTILDFIGAQRREFQFASRFRALSTKPAQQLDQEIEHGFPHLPSGCVIQLERVAQQRVLENVKNTIRLHKSRIISSLREMGIGFGYVPTLADALDYFSTNLDELLKRGLWSSLLAEAGLIEPMDDPDQKQLAKGLRRISHVDCVYQIEQWLQHIDQVEISKGEDSRIFEMLHVSLWGKQSIGWSISESRKRLLENTGACQDLKAILNHQRQRALTHEAGRLPSVSGPLTIHAQYTRDEILIGLGHWSLKDRPDQREGVLHLKDAKVDAFFVTLQKTEADYSPTTMYEDYLISHNLFHWQSQSNTSVSSPTGQRYINHRSMGYTPLLFVRETKKRASGLTTPYYYLGPCEYVSHSGNRPLNIIWRLTNSVPAKIYRQMARQAIG
ncbi:type I restriction enzyme EcoKI subunit R [Gimesia alba]|uniref:Type I restriction enzyme EcoKI subunit R n=1 Tax=Gimesia alba TaxID=2527973 RepID=A0A517RMF7_9PLAN|nr:DEAD/DEAH box helicase [Gimesia alba]QDT45068.1 type I restriction enzyme EcoKI subunit R [Gimesia alba]